MNNSQLVEAVDTAAALEKRQAERAVHAAMSTVIDAVRAGNSVAQIGFGTFNPTRRNARMGHKLQTAAPVRSNASKGVRIAAGSAFKDALDSNRPIEDVGAVKEAASKRAPANKRPVAKEAPANGRTTTAAKAARKR